MNYRHAFHAGNFADVVKHVVVARILTRLRDKETPFRVIDTHAGEGLYDLASEAARTGEWHDGIGRLADADVGPEAAALLAPYLDAVRAVNGGGELRRYPGSPVLARHLLREGDRLIACELEPHAAAALSRCLHGPSAKVMEIDGYVALKACVPPKERRGLVIVDPPFEREDEFARLADGVAAAYRKWPTGIYLVWYPVTRRNDPGRFVRTLRAGVDKCLRIEWSVAPSRPDGGLTACGVVVVNPPWKLAADMAVLARPLAAVLGRRQDGSREGESFVIEDLSEQERRPGGRPTHKES